MKEETKQLNTGLADKTVVEQKDKKKKPRGKGKLFVSGISGNPKGRPKGTLSILTILKHELAKYPEGDKKKNYAELIVKKVITDALENGDDQKIKLIFNYIEGMPEQRDKPPVKPVKLKQDTDTISLLKNTINLVRTGKMDVKSATVVGQLTSHLMKAVELSDMTVRLERIEEEITRINNKK